VNTSVVIEVLGWEIGAVVRFRYVPDPQAMAPAVQLARFVVGKGRLAVVAPPIDLLLYLTDELRITRHRRFQAKDADLREIHHNWERALRRAVLDLPAIQFEAPGEEDPEAL
jgi:hypothetical protein